MIVCDTAAPAAEDGLVFSDRPQVHIYARERKRLFRRLPSDAKL